MSAEAPARVALVGAGPGDPGLLTLKAARAIATCDVLVYDQLVAAPVVALAAPECELIFVGKKAGAHTLPQSEINVLLVRLAREGKRVVRLKGGDVFVFGRGGEEAEALVEAGVPFEVVPGISSALAVPAYAGIPLTHRAHNTSFTVATGHEDPTKDASSLDFSKLANPAQTLVFLMAMGNLAGIVERLRANGLSGETPVAIVRDGTTPRQTTVVATLDSIVAAAERAEITAPAIVVIGEVVRERERLRWFDEPPLFGKKVLITRPRGSADAFAAKLWELGAEPLIAPTIEIVPPDDSAPADLAVREVRIFHWVLFTSGPGVEAFFVRLEAGGRDARALGDVSIAAIGPRTAERLLERGIRADYIPERYIGEELAEGLLERSEPGQRILLFRAQEAGDVLPERLRAEGRRVDDVAAYQTRVVRDPAIASAARAADIWTFTSASTVRGLVDNVPGAAEISASKFVACLGPVTADAARVLGLTVSTVAREYTVDGLLAALRCV